jgi:DNA repair protein RecO (recombination protein O)
LPRTFKTEAIVLRSIRYGEADRVLHLYTPDRGRIGAVAKGVRRVKSRLGGRLEPLSRVRLVLHEGRGELCTISQVDTVHPHAALRERRESLERATQACEAVLRLLDSTESNRPAYNLLCNELSLLDADAAAAGRAQALAFRLKLLLAAGFAPELASCAACGEAEELGAYSPSAGGVVCAGCAARRARSRSARRRTGSSSTPSPGRSPRRRRRPRRPWPKRIARSPRRWSSTRTCD